MPCTKRFDPLRDDVPYDDLVAELGEAPACDEPDPARAEDPDCPRICHAGGAYRRRGERPFAIASIVSFESESRIVLITQ